jgi:hypothetical protein
MGFIPTTDAEHFTRWRDRTPFMVEKPGLMRGLMRHYGDSALNIGQPHDGRRDASGFVRRQMFACVRPFFQAVPIVN